MAKRPWFDHPQIPRYWIVIYLYLGTRTTDSMHDVITQRRVGNEASENKVRAQPAEGILEQVI